MLTLALVLSATLRRVVLIANPMADFFCVLVLLPLVRPSRIASGSIPGVAPATEISNMPAASVVIECWLGSAIVCNLGSSPDATQVEHGISVKIFAPPISVGDGLGEHRVPRLGDIEVGLDSSQFFSIMLPLDVSANAVEVLIPHSNVGHVDDEPSLVSVRVVKTSHQLSIVVEEFSFNSSKEQERGAQHSE